MKNMQMAEHLQYYIDKDGYGDAEFQPILSLKLPKSGILLQ